MTQQEGKPPHATGIAHFIRSCKYSFNGFREGCKESAFRQELAFCIVVIPLAWLLPFPATHSAFLTVCYLFLLTTELLNTAVEAVVDLASPGYHELAKRAKDLASASVTCAITANAVAWLGCVIAYFKH
ncbi:MAG: diacylglycerol kinase [Victivallales bacterium]|nr:diacylglycerol kinase [Victivallales bacterium]